MAQSTELIPLTFNEYEDDDQDGFGDANNAFEACYLPTGFVVDNTDCDDDNAAMYPGLSEVCDGMDNDCNGQTDEGVLNTYYLDRDSDGFGDQAIQSKRVRSPVCMPTIRMTATTLNPLLIPVHWKPVMG